MKILVVDDDDFTTRLLHIQLRAMELRNSGYTGIELCARVDIDAEGFGLVFCDLRMPVMDGIEFVRHLAEAGFRGALVLMSGAEPRVLQAAEQLARSHGLNVLGILSKPVQPEALRALLGRVGPAAAESSASRAPAPAVGDAAALEAAITSGELFNLYQPKVDLGSGEVVGVGRRRRAGRGPRGTSRCPRTSCPWPNRRAC